MVDTSGYTLCIQLWILFINIAMALEQLNAKGQEVKKWIKLLRLNHTFTCPQNST